MAAPCRHAGAFMLRLAQLYDPVRDDLEQSVRIFREALCSEYESVARLYAHVERFRGKQIRPALLLLAARACGEVRPAHHVLAAVVEMVHLATLVHDDVLDEADVRRRTATVNRRWGNERAVLLGDLLFSHAYRLCSGLDTPDAARLIARTAVTVCEGEMAQIAHRGDYSLTEREYFEIITRKTASLLGVCGLLGARHAGADEQMVCRMRDFGVALGVAFQITDDLLDLLGDEDEAGKSLGRDVQKGKLTLPLIHYLRTAAPAERDGMLALLRATSAAADGPDGPAPAAGGDEIAARLAASESIEYASTTAAQHLEIARDALDALSPGDARSSLVAMVEFVAARPF